MTPPLSGLRVVDLSSGMAGPRATGLLADYGADVIWVERPGGDPLRQALAVPYSVFNRGKRSISLDLRDVDGRDSLFALLASADVLVTSWRPGVADRLGLGRDQLGERFPALVQGAVTGFGMDGRWKDVPGYESLAHAVAGSTGEQVGHREGPIYQALPFASIGASSLLLIGVLGALHRRCADGHGRRVETSLLDGALAYLAMTWGDADDENLAPPIQPGRMRLVARTFRCSDDEYVGVHTAAVGAFGRLMGVLELQSSVPSELDGTDMRVPLTPEQSRTVMEEIPRIFATRPRDAWVATLMAADICAIPAMHPGEVFDAPQARHNEMVVTVDDPVLGPVEQVAPAISFPAAPPSVGRAAPRVGEHTEEVLAEIRPPLPTPTAPLAADVPLLADLRVLDLGAYYAGPYSARLLADLGADVIKLETTLGDQLRGIARPFRSAQAGKRGISLNLKDPELGPALRGLVERSDVVCHNMRPGAATRLGLDPAQVRDLNPSTIYLYAPGWGSTGPDAQRQSFAPMLSGYVGASYEIAGRFNEPLFPLGNEDPGNGLLGAVAILTALYARDRDGTALYVENSQLNATMSHLAHVVRTADGEVLGAMRLDPLQMGFCSLDRLYETSDGWISLAVGDHELARLEDATGLDLVDDDRFATPEARREHDEDLLWLLTEVIGGGTTDEWVDRLSKHGLGVVVPAAVNHSRAFHRDPENHRSGRVVEIDHPKQGVVRELAHLVRVSGAVQAEHRLAPEMGEHTDEVLTGLGYSSEQLAALRERGSIRSTDLRGS